MRDPGADRSEPASAQDLLAEYFRRREAGEAIEFEEYCRRFPEHEEALRRLYAPPVSTMAGGGATRLAPEDEVRPGDVATEKMPGAPIPADRREPVGGRIGRYRLISELGKGGFGIVYLAEQSEPLHRRVALKVIKLGMEGEDILARFESERQALALMNHPNIAKIYDAGTTPEGRPYFAMELVEGAPITRYCDEGRLGLDDRLRLFRQACRGIHHAHAKGIIHRDIKPTNILVSTVDGQPLVKIIDFGIAKAMDRISVHKTMYTAMGCIIGTPAYMSPEQATTSATRELDERTDVYSLGVVLYELLVGELPMDEEVLAKASLDEILRRLREDDFPVPSLRWARLSDARLKTLADRRGTRASSLGGRVRGDLDWIVMKALEKDRTRRYPTPAALTEDLDRFLASEPVTAGPPSALYRLKKFARKHRGFLLSVAAVLSILLSGLAVTTGLYLQTERVSREKGIALRRSEGLRMAAESSAVLPTNPGLSLLLAVEAARRAPGLTSNCALLSALERVRERKTLAGHGARISAGAFSPDGRLAVTAAADGKAIVWDAGTGAARAVLAAGTAPIEAATFGPRGDAVLIESKESASLWGLDGSRRFSLGGPSAPARSVRFSPDGLRLLAVVSGDLRLLDAATGETIRPLGEDGRPWISARFDPSGSRVVAVSRDRTIASWEAGTGRPGFAVAEAGAPGPDPPAFSPDGRTVLARSEDGSAQLRSAGTGEVLSSLRVAREPFASAEFSPDGKWVLTTSAEGAPRVWSAATGEEKYRLHHGDGFLRAVFSPDSRWVLTASSPWSSRPGMSSWVRDYDGGARLWSLETGRPAAEIRGKEKSAVARVRFGPDGARLLVLIDEKPWPDFAYGQAPARSPEVVAALYEARTGQQVFPLLGHRQGTIAGGAFGPDGATLLTFGSDATARLWDIEARDALCFLRRNRSDPFADARFAPRGKGVLARSAGGSLELRSLETGRPVFRIGGDGTAAPRRASFSEDGARIVAVDEDGGIRLLDAGTGAEVLSIPGARGASSPESSVAISRDGERVIAALPGSAAVWNARTGERIASWPDIAAASADPGGDLIFLKLRDRPARPGATGGAAAGSPAPDAPGDRPADEEVGRIVEARTGRELVILRVPTAGAGRPIFSPDGRKLLERTGDGAARVWDATSGKALFSVMGHRNHEASPGFVPDGLSVLERSATLGARIEVAESEFGPDSRRFLTWSKDKTLRLWDAGDGRGLATFGDDGSGVNSGSFSADGKMVAVGLDDGRVRLWDIAAGRERPPLRGHRLAVLNAVFSGDGSKVLSLSRDETARVWDVSTGSEILILPDHGAPVIDGEFSPDGSWVATRTADKKARLWPVEPAALAERCRPRELDPAERSYYEISPADR